MRKSQKKIIHRAIDGEVSKTETRILRRTLQQDGQARAEFEQLKKVVEASGKVRIEVPPGFTEKVVEAVERETRRLRRFP